MQSWKSVKHGFSHVKKTNNASLLLEPLGFSLFFSHCNARQITIQILYNLNGDLSVTYLKKLCGCLEM